MKERPILFNAPMVRAILSGQKTQTRRGAKPVKHPDLGNLYYPGALVLEREPQHVIERACPYGQPGDRLRVRETHSYAPDHDEPAGCARVLYAADGERYGKLHPSIHMPRWASRILLEIVSVRVERLQDISEADAEAEGIDFLRRVPDADETLTAKELYECLWESINGAGSWNANPWVWAIEFKRIPS